MPPWLSWLDLTRLASVSTWILALALSVALKILLNEPFQYLLARVLGGIVPRRPRGVKGLWLSVYDFTSEGQRWEGVQIVELRQVFNYVTGRSYGGNFHRHLLRGRIKQEMFFTGIWRNTQTKVIYHGAFQFFIHPRGEIMDGKWVGFEHRNSIAHGNWHWKLLSHSVKKSERLSILTKYADRIAPATLEPRRRRRRDRQGD